MKSSTNKKSEIEEHEKNNPNQNLNGDRFHDFVGKFCNSEYKENTIAVELTKGSFLMAEENVNDQSGDIPEESERN